MHALVNSFARHKVTRVVCAPTAAFEYFDFDLSPKDPRHLLILIQEIQRQLTDTRIENGADAKQSTMDALQRALEAAVVEFTNGEQPGVRLTKAAASASNPMVAGKAARHKTAKAPKKKR